MGLARPGQTEREDVRRLVNELARSQVFELLLELHWEATQIEFFPDLACRELCSTTHAFDTTLATVTRLELHDGE